MATYFVASGGSNTAPYDTWAKAATSLQTALTAATATGDIVVIQYNAVPSGDAESAADTTYTFGGNVLLVSASNDGGSAWTPTVMGTANWIGHSTQSRSVTWTGAFKVQIYGITVRNAGASTDRFQFNLADGGHYELDSLYLWLGTTAATNGTDIFFGGAATNGNYFTSVKNTTLRFSNASQECQVGGEIKMANCVLSSAGTAPTALFLSANNFTSLQAVGCDFSFIGANALVSGASSNSSNFRFDRCKIGTGTLFSTHTPANRSAHSALALDCSNGDTHGLIRYEDAFGTLTSDTGIFYTSGVAAQSWKIVTTADCSFYTPFVSPVIALYNTGTSAITPYLEILRDGSTTAYDNDEVWAEFQAKVTSTSTASTAYSDRMALGGTPAAQANGAGLGSWTGESGTAWSGKIDSGSSLTPAEVGDISVQVCVGLASATVYVDPQIRT